MPFLYPLIIIIYTAQLARIIYGKEDFDIPVNTTTFFNLDMLSLVDINKVKSMDGLNL